MPSIIKRKTVRLNEAQEEKKKNKQASHTIFLFQSGKISLELQSSRSLLLVTTKK
jgi:hypothetical protein